MLLWCFVFINYICHRRIHSMCNTVCLDWGFYELYLCKYFLCYFLKTYQAELNLFSYSGLTALILIYIKTAKAVLIRLPCLMLSSSGKTWYGRSLQGCRGQLHESTRNLKPRTVYSGHHVGSPELHHCFPKTLLPTVLVSKTSVNRVCIYIQGVQNVFVHLMNTVQKQAIIF
jgi:hypothetical protein